MIGVVKSCAQSTVVWTIQGGISWVAGYYCLGMAYDRGVMAEIDRVAIAFLKPKVGVLGLGPLMPQVQWYAGWGIRVSVSVVTWSLCAVVIKVGKTAYIKFWKSPDNGRTVERTLLKPDLCSTDVPLPSR